MNIKLNVYKYLTILILLVSIATTKMWAQNTANTAKFTNVTLASLAIISNIEFENEENIPYPKTLKMDKKEIKSKKDNIQNADSVTRIIAELLMPAEYLNFNSVVSNNNAMLQWNLSNLPEAEELILEQSTDNIAFEEVSAYKLKRDKVNGVIIPQAEGLVYYRLNVRDEKGANTYTESVACNIDTKASGIVSIFPNTITDEYLTGISIATTYRGKIKVVITDDHGQQLIEFHREIITDKTKIPLGVATIPKGTYSVFISQSNGNHIGATQEIVKL